MIFGRSGLVRKYEVRGEGRGIESRRSVEGMIILRTCSVEKFKVSRSDRRFVVWKFGRMNDYSTYTFGQEI